MEQGGGRGVGVGCARNDVGGKGLQATCRLSVGESAPHRCDHEGLDLGLRTLAPTELQHAVLDELGAVTGDRLDQLVDALGA